MEDKKVLKEEELKKVVGGTFAEDQAEKLRICFNDAVTSFRDQSYFFSRLNITDYYEKYTEMAQLCEVANVSDYNEVCNTLNRLYEIAGNDLNALQIISNLERRIDKIIPSQTIIF